MPSLSVYPSETKRDGVIVVKARCPGNLRWEIFAVKAHWREQRDGSVAKLILFGGKGSPQFWDPKKKVQMYCNPGSGSAWIEVKIDDTCYTSSQERARQTGFTYVADTNLLIKWWGDAASDEDVKQAAVETEKELGLEAQLAEQTKMIASLRTEIGKWQTQIDLERKALEAQVDAWKKEASNLATLLDQHWFVGRETRRRIQTVIRQCS